MDSRVPSDSVGIESGVTKNPYFPSLTVPTQNKHIFMRPKKCAYYGCAYYVWEQYLINFLDGKEKMFQL